MMKRLLLVLVSASSLQLIPALPALAGETAVARDRVPTVESRAVRTDTVQVTGNVTVTDPYAATAIQTVPNPVRIVDNGDVVYHPEDAAFIAVPNSDPHPAGMRTLPNPDPRVEQRLSLVPNPSRRVALLDVQTPPASSQPAIVTAPKKLPPPVVPPTPAPSPTEPQDANAALALAQLFAQLAIAAYRAGTLVAYASAACALAYLLMFLIKTGIKDKIVPEKYLGAMQKALAFLAVAASVAGYVAGGGGFLGLLTGGAAGLGAASSSLFHDLLDGLAAHRKTTPK